MKKCIKINTYNKNKIMSHLYSPCLPTELNKSLFQTPLRRLVGCEKEIKIIIKWSDIDHPSQRLNRLYNAISFSFFRTKQSYEPSTSCVNAKSTTIHLWSNGLDVSLWI